MEEPGSGKQNEYEFMKWSSQYMYAPDGSVSNNTMNVLGDMGKKPP